MIEETKEVFPGEILLGSFTLTFCNLILGFTAVRRNFTIT